MVEAQRGLRRFFFGVVIAVSLIAAPFAQSQTTLISEGFEGIFPGSWSVGDDDPRGTPAYWRDVDVSFGSPFPRSGNWMGYCAGVGFAGSSFAPNYRPYMEAVMQRSVNLAGASSASLSFWFNIPEIEGLPFDYCAVEVNGDQVWVYDTETIDWQRATISLDAYVGGTATITFGFVSDLSVEYEGWYLDDILVTATGITLQPNLTPYQPTGWSDKLVVSKMPGTTTDDTNFEPSDTLYIDWAVINNGAGTVNSTFRTELYVNGVLQQFWSGDPPMPPNQYRFDTDYNLGMLTAGTHTIAIRADTEGAVAESNESDNEYSKTITVTGTPDIRIDPLTVTFNVTNSGGGFAPAQSPDAGPVSLSAAQKLLLAGEVSQRFDAGAGRVDVIVNLASPPGKPRGGEWASKARLPQWHRAVKSRQDEVLSTLAAGEFRMRHCFQNQSGFSGSVSREGLHKLANHPKVESIELVRILKPSLAQGIPLMNAAIYRSNYNGSGVAVAIVDSGVDYTHSRLGGASFPNSKVVGGYDFGDLDPDPQADGNAHGTACAGIAAGDFGTIDDYIGGVAANAKIYALKVTSGASGTGSSDEIIAAWDWCITHKNDDPANPILVISTSFGGQRYSSACDSALSAYATAANNVVAAGITVLASSGNEGYCDSISSPACLSAVISVGAVYDADYGTVTLCINPESCVSKYFDPSCDTGFGTESATAPDRVTPYSNTASFLDLLAPAHRAYTTDIVGAGGSSHGDYIPDFGGTSAACPYAAGAVAALQSAAQAALGRFLTPAEVRQTLASTGDPVTDTKAAITTPRVNLGRAIETLGQSGSFTIFNDGNAILSVSSIALDSAAPWLSWTPDAPFTIAPGTARVVALSVDPSLAPPGETTRRLLITSDDSDESPYLGGVFVTVTNGVVQPMLQASRVADKFVFSWPTSAAGFLLQSIGDLSGGTWGTVSPAPVVVGDQYFVTNTITGNRQFYRLQK